MRRGCQVVLFGRPQGPVRDNLEGAQQDAVGLKLAQYDDEGRLFLDAGTELRWVPIRETSSPCANAQG